MSPLHDFIYRLEEGGGKLFMKIAVTFLALFLVLLSYNWLCFRNMATQEAMDYAQLGRNIAEGKGFTTLFVRPFSIYLLQTRTNDSPPLNAPWGTADLARLKGMHPDIANAPLYPFLLAGLMKVFPFHFAVDLTHRFWSTSGKPISPEGDESLPTRVFRRYQPDFLISVFNQVLLLVVAGLNFTLARRLFDLKTAQLSTVLLLGTDLLWRFAISGLATTVLLLIFSCLAWSLVRLQEKVDQLDPVEDAEESLPATVKPPQPDSTTPAPLRSQEAAPLLWAGIAGALVGLGALTRYPFAWLLLPVLGFILLFTGRRRVVLALTVFFAFTLVLLPWVVRNYLVSGAPFGTATYAVLEGSLLFPGNDLQRSLVPDLNFPGLAFLRVAWRKLLSNGGQIIQSDLPRLGGTWVASFFIIGALMPTGSQRIRRLGCFAGSSLVILALVQALVRTQLSSASPEINSENLLVLLVPLLWMFGASFFFRLLGERDGSIPQIKAGVIGVFAGVTCLPLILSLLAFSRSPVVFPPYYPPAIQTTAGFLKADELMMSDIPWAVAWYGRVQCAWLTQDERDFFRINDRLKPIQALYLTHAGGGGQLQGFDQWIRAGDENWGGFILDCLLHKQQGKPGPPPEFPLEYWQKGWPMHFLLTRRESPPRGGEGTSSSPEPAP